MVQLVLKTPYHFIQSSSIMSATTQCITGTVLLYVIGNETANSPRSDSMKASSIRNYTEFGNCTERWPALFE